MSWGKPKLPIFQGLTPQRSNQWLAHPFLYFLDGQCLVGKRKYLEIYKSGDVIPDSKALGAQVLIFFQQPNPTEGILEDMKKSCPSICGIPRKWKAAEAVR